MPFAITGGRYASANISAVGTSTVTVSAAPFVQADFVKTRLVGLWSNSGAFKGMTWARRWLTSGSIELERPFFDPATGQAVTQLVGDQILVSKDFSESVVTGLTVSGRIISITDTCTFGADNNQLGVCFYDENKLISATSGILLSGGLTVFGKLDNYNTNAVSGSVDIQSTVISVLLCNNSAVNFCGYGGRWESSAGGGASYFIGGNNQGTAGNTVIINGVESPNDMLTNTAGGAWARNPERHQLVNCYGLTTAANAILRRWGDGIIRGGRYRFPNNASAPISVFGSDSPGIYTVSASPGERSIVQDMGAGPALVRASTPGTAVTFNFTNLITTDSRSVSGVSGSLAPNPAGVNTFRFSDTYTGLQPGTVGVVLNNVGGLVDSVASSETSWAPSLLRRTCVGATVTINATSWTYGFKRYGFQPVGGMIAPTVYDLGTAGQADNVVFGGIVNQLIDSNITLTQTAAAALAQIDNLDQLYDALINWGVSSTANARYPSIAAYPIAANGTLRDLGSLNLAVNRTAATAININTSTNTITIKSDNLTAGIKGTSLKTTGTITAVNGATISAAVEDSNGVRVTIRKSGGGLFNIAARYGTTGAYTDLGYQADVSTVTYTVPKGQPVEVLMWSLGCVTYSRTISTAGGGVVFDAEMTLNESINTALDVSAYLPNIALSLDTSGANPVFVITFNAPMTISGIELGKAVVHRLVGQQVALQSGFPLGSTATIAINADEITNQLPAARLALGASLSATDRVYLDFFINTAPAVAINPAYVINPVRADGNQVIILRAKPALDSSVLAAAVWGAASRTLTSGGGGVTLEQIEGSTVLAKASGVTAAQTTIVAEINGNEAKLDTLQTTANGIKAKTDTLTNGPSAADIRTAMETNGGKLDKAMKAAQAAEDQTV